MRHYSQTLAQHSSKTDHNAYIAPLPSGLEKVLYKYSETYIQSELFKRTVCSHSQHFTILVKKNFKLSTASS